MNSDIINPKTAPENTKQRGEAMLGYIREEEELL